MDKERIRAGDWQELTEVELQLRGGIGWEDILKVIKFVEQVVTFVKDYKEEIKRGFLKGWRML